MAKQYTADEMREIADEIGLAHDDIHEKAAAMLYHAADATEREKKYEYAECYFTSSISSLHESSEEDVRLYASNGSTVVRRLVGEWEPVPRRCGE